MYLYLYVKTPSRENEMPASTKYFNEKIYEFTLQMTKYSDPASS